MNYKTFINTSACLIFLSGLLALPAQAAVVSSSMVQLTAAQDSNTGPIVDSSYPDISADGSTVAFYSNADLVTDGNTSNVDTIFIIKSDGTDLRQLTSAVAGDSRNPRLSTDGSVVVFESDANLINDENPPEEVIIYPGTIFEDTKTVRYSQIFIMNSDGTGLRQLTRGRGGDSTNPDITDDGNTVVFQSSQDLLDENADGTVELFVVNADGSGLMQITEGAPKIAGKRDDASRAASISADGSKIAFDSFIDLTPPLNDDFSNEIFVFDLTAYLANGALPSSRSAYTRQLSDTDIDDPAHILAEDAFEASISADGTWVAFAACINPLGTNPTLADVIFVVKSDGTNLTQLTFVNDIKHDARMPSISADGTAVMFTAKADLVAGNNLDLGNELFASSTDGAWLSQVTDDSVQKSGRIRTRISADGTQVVYHSKADFTGGNADGNKEIFLQSIVLPVANPPVSGDDDGTVSDGTGAFAFIDLLMIIIALAGLTLRNVFSNQPPAAKRWV
ncbi:MAG: PD40 domain-containing protein [Thiotrichaceae bacterium]|nr:PD40 domain-containing protein [Thiotrichaceae bacterium]